MIDAGKLPQRVAGYVAKWLKDVFQDVRQGCRIFVKAPSFATIAVVSIACGTGANVAMFSVADALLLRPLPVPNPDELLIIGSPVERVFRSTVASYPDYIDIRDSSGSLDDLLAQAITWTGVQTLPNAPPSVTPVAMVSGNFFDVLKIRPELGRWFLSEEDRVPGRDAVAVLSHGFWLSRFASDPSVLGKPLTINGRSFVIIGVAPEGFNGLSTRGLPESVYVPLAMAPAIGISSIRNLLDNRERRILSLRGRLRPGVSVTEARAELDLIAQNLAETYPDTNEDQRLMIQTEIGNRLASNDLDIGLVLLMTILSTAVLAVACANVAGLIASRGPLRTREISIRMAMGASRARLVRQLVTEASLLAIAGGLGGLVVGRIGIALLRQIQFPTDIVQVPVMELDGRALMFNLAVAMTSAFLVGLGPALQTTRTNLVNAMKRTEDRGKQRWSVTARGNLVAVQVAMSMVLVTVAVLTWQVFSQVATSGSGFRTSQVAKVTVDTQHRSYRPDQSTAFFEQALDAARRIPGVTSAATISAMPLWEVELAEITPMELESQSRGEARATVRASVDDDFFQTMDIPLVQGRGFLPTDTIDSARVAIVNETLARRYWPNQDAVGRRFRLDGAESPFEVIGIARDATYIYVAEPPQQAVYFSYRQEPRPRMTFLARTSGDSVSAIDPLREAVRSLDPDMPVLDAQSIETFYEARATGILRVAAEIIGSMGLMGVMLTMVGLYALAAYSVRRRTREIGVRMAIGATHWRVLKMSLLQGIRPVWFGLAIGVALSLIVARLLPAVLPTLQRYDPLTYAIAIPSLLILAVLATWVPAQHAARVDPTVALRHE